MKITMKFQVAICMCLLGLSWGLTNVALNKPAKQSSLYPGHGRPQTIVDGNKATNIQACTSTNKDTNSWWRVDLQKQYEVFSVVITNRGDCCGDRLRDFRILVTDTEPSNPAQTTRDTVCNHQVAAVPQGKTVTLTCNKPITGRYVTLVLLQPNWLNFCELEVMAKEPITSTDLTNVALNKPAKQSSLYPGHGRPQTIVDGNKATNIQACTSTNKDTNSWWRVDLQKQYEVFSVVITNRGDCCGDRLRDFRILVTDTEPSNPAQTTTDTVCKHQVVAVPQGKTVTLTCNKPITGRYVTLVLLQPNFLNFCELEVMAKMPTTDPCDSKPCLNGGTCSKDGDGQSVSYHCTCVAGYEGDNCETVKEIVNTPCGDGSECTAPNTECFKETCLCTPGYYYSNDTKSCVETCDNLLSTFTLYPGAMIKKNRLYAKAEIPVAQCQTLCAENSACVAFTRKEKGRKPKCIFHKKTAKDVGDSWRPEKAGYDYYQRNCR